MSDYHIYIKMPSYLRQWFVHRHSGTEPVRLRNGSIESKLIKLAVVKPPVSAIPTRQREDEVAICIPYSKTRDPRIYNHITDTGKRALLENVKNSFDVDCGRSCTTSAGSANSRKTSFISTWSNVASRRTALAGTLSRKYTNACVRIILLTNASEKTAR